MKRTVAYAVYVVSVTVALAVACAGQGPRTGTFRYGSFAGGPDTVDLANNNVEWTIPIRHKPGRGTNFDYDLVCKLVRLDARDFREHYELAARHHNVGCWLAGPSPGGPGLHYLRNDVFLRHLRTIWKLQLADLELWKLHIL